MTWKIFQSPMALRTQASAAPAADMVASARSLHGDPWFTEVIELRKRAKDYMVREHARALHALSCRAPF